MKMDTYVQFFTKIETLYTLNTFIYVFNSETHSYMYNCNFFNGKATSRFYIIFVVYLSSYVCSGSKNIIETTIHFYFTLINQYCDQISNIN